MQSKKGDMPRTQSRICSAGWSRYTICQSNIDSVTRILEKRGIDICACALGGLFRKSVSIDLETGEVRYSEGGGKEKLLWRATGAKEFV